MDSVRKPSVLFAYYTYTQQTLKVVEAMADVLRSRGCEVHLAAIEFIDPRYAKRLGVFPMPHPFLEVLGMIPAELRRRPGKIRVPDVVTEREYDLVCIGSPTWWLSTNVPIRSFLQSEAASLVLKGKQFAAAVPCRRYWRHNLKTVKRLGAERGGVFTDGIHSATRDARCARCCHWSATSAPASTATVTSGSRYRRPTSRRPTCRRHENSPMHWPTAY